MTTTAAAEATSGIDQEGVPLRSTNQQQEPELKGEGSRPPRYVPQHVTEARRDWIVEHCAGFANDPTPSVGRDSSRAVMDYDRTLTLLLAAVNRACGIIECGDQRLLASDGPAGNQPPDLSLAEWRQMYKALDTARQAAR